MADLKNLHFFTIEGWRESLSLHFTGIRSRWVPSHSPPNADRYQKRLGKNHLTNPNPLPPSDLKNRKSALTESRVAKRILLNDRNSSLPKISFIAFACSKYRLKFLTGR